MARHFIAADKHLAKVLSYIGHAEGAKLLTGGQRVSTGDLAAGSYLVPAVFADVDNEWRIAQEEVAQ